MTGTERARLMRRLAGLIVENAESLAVVAKSFARIHRRNLITQDVLPLVFDDEADYSHAQPPIPGADREHTHPLSLRLRDADATGA